MSRTNHFRDFKGSLVSSDLDLKGRFCPRPFEHFEVMHGFGKDQAERFGDVYVCCAGWLNKPIGNYLEQDLNTIWNSDAAKEIRASILDGSFRYCNKQACSLIQNDELLRVAVMSPKFQNYYKGGTELSQPPMYFYLCYDRSCNLSCKSCRNEMVFFTSGIGYENPMRLNEKLIQDVFTESTERRIVLSITGSGDPFASPVFRDLLERIDPEKFPGLEIELFTNGLLMTPNHWLKIQHLAKCIRKISVSIDAASTETYTQVRGGSWTQLTKNMQFISELRRDGKIASFCTNFVVQTANFREIPDFVTFCHNLNVDRVHFSLISNWSTWAPEEFDQQCIWRKDHAQFGELLEVLKNPILDHPIVSLGSLVAYRQTATSVMAGERSL